jgi:hypothetical protein
MIYPETNKQQQSRNCNNSGEKSLEDLKDLRDSKDFKDSKDLDLAQSGEFHPGRQTERRTERQ